jgi:outer membrane receptor for ferrienterochelin and colicins
MCNNQSINIFYENLGRYTMGLQVLSLGLILYFNSYLTLSVQDKVILNELIGMSLAELLQVEVDVASKSSETIFDAPSSVTVYTRQELLNMGITSVEEALNYIPGFIGTREIVFGSGYMVSARGMTTPQASYNVLFMIDGQRLNDDVSGGALAHNFYIPIANVKQIEVIRGPGSALYGTSAFSGVVNIVTVTDVNDVFISAGSMASREAYTNFSKSFENGYFAGFARYFEDNGQSIYPSLVGQDVLTSDPLAGNDIYLSTKYDRFSVQFRHSQRDRDEFAITTEVLDGINQKFTEYQSLKLGYQLFETNNFQLDIDLNYIQMRTKGMSLIKSLANLPDKSILNNLIEGRNSKESEFSLNIEAHYRFNDQHKLIAGLQYRHPRINFAYNSYNYNPLATDYLPYTGVLYEMQPLFVPGFNRDIFGAYVQNKYEFNEQLSMTLGLRYDRFSDFGGTVTPRANLTYTPSEKTKFKWMYGEAFRAPATRQGYILLNNLANPDLKSETIKTMELAWLQKFDRAQTTLTYFYSRAKNKIDTILIPLDGLNFIRQFQNISGDLTSAGWEFELSSQLTDSLSLRTAYTYLNNMQESPQHFPQQTFSMVLNYQINKWNFNFNGYYHDETEQQLLRQGVNVLDDYWLFNAAVRYALTQDLTIVGRIHNLLDEEFYNSTKFPIRDGVLNRGRTYSLGIEWRL